jgi:DNA topoisomerase I
MRLRRSDPAASGYRRVRRGRGFSYLDIAGRTLDETEVVRCRDLVIPPAWRDVWICPDPLGHLQATGVDGAGRRQYLYHPQWRARRDRRKFNHVRRVADRLPRLRRRIAQDLAAEGLSRNRVLAAAARLIDKGLFRVGSDEYPTFGVATLQGDHVRCRGTRAWFCYQAKGDVRREITITDRAVVAVLGELARHRRSNQRLLAYRDGDVWREVHASDINDYLRSASGMDMTAKDLRTWHATVIAAAAFAKAGRAGSQRAARRTVVDVMREVADELGNTPAVARASYVDPEIVDAYRQGRVATMPPSGRLGPAAERATLDLLST